MRVAWVSFDVIGRECLEAAAVRVRGGGGRHAPTVRGRRRADYFHLYLRDMRLDTIPHAEVNAVVEEQVYDFRPSVVYTVHPDVNRHHRAVFDSIAVATRPVPGQVVRRALTRGPTSSVEWIPPGARLFPPNWYADIGETIEAELAAFTGDETEGRPHPRNERGIRAHAEFHGVGAGCHDAEPFVLVRSVEGGAA